MPLPLSHITKGNMDNFRLNEAFEYAKKVDGRKIKKIDLNPDKLNYEERKVYDALYEMGCESRHIDEIVEKTNINPARCILILTTLQISGYVESNMPSYYKIASDPYYK